MKNSFKFRCALSTSTVLGTGNTPESRDLVSASGGGGGGWWWEVDLKGNVTKVCGKQPRVWLERSAHRALSKCMIPGGSEMSVEGGPSLRTRQRVRKKDTDPLGYG